MNRTTALLIAALFITTGCTEAVSPSDEAADPIDECATCSAGKGDSLAITDDSYLGQAILELANTASHDTLDHDVRLNVRAADSIYMGRPFETLEQLDEAYYVGITAFGRMASYVTDRGMVGSCGDGVLQSAEVCDDGNGYDGDGCDVTCNEAEFYEAPVFLTTEPQTISGPINEAETLRIRIDGAVGDTVVFRVSNLAGGFDPELEVYDRDYRIQYSRPEGLEEAHIPWKVERLAEGFTFREGSEYYLEIKNTLGKAGHFELSIECLSGTCGAVVEPGEHWYDVPAGQLEQAFRDEVGYFTKASYSSARTFMFSELDNENGYVTCVYTGRQVQTWGIPFHMDMNTEHVWPQSLYGPETDLHHLMPTDYTANGKRSSFPFGEVLIEEWAAGGSALGTDAIGAVVFEPRDDIKGNVARAKFYVATMYELDIPDAEEAVLRTWHELDPPDAREQTRNKRIRDFQGSENYYITHPELVGVVADF